MRNRKRNVRSSLDYEFIRNRHAWIREYGRYRRCTAKDFDTAESFVNFLKKKKGFKVLKTIQDKDGTCRVYYSVT